MLIDHGSVRLRIALAAAVLLALISTFIFFLNPERTHQRLVLTPLIGGLTPCILGDSAGQAQITDEVFRECAKPEGSAQPIIDATLNRLGPKFSVNSQYELGYTLVVPVLGLLNDVNGRWLVNQVAIDRLMKTIRDTDRKVVLYLFSTHFSLPTQLEELLAKDVSNLAVTPSGPMSKDKYYGMDVYPWSIARTDNAITSLRLQVFTAISNALCEQRSQFRDRIVGISVLGETHHQFPDFERGMGFDRPYFVSDYSNASIAVFRAFLRERFRDINELNEALGGASFRDFESVEPPSKDIRREPFGDIFSHIDSYAGGVLPIEGWLAPNSRLTGWVHIFVDDQLFGKVQAGLGRQDVLNALPDIGTADVGWRYDLDFRKMATGAHRVSAFAEETDGRYARLGQKTIKVLRVITQESPDEIQTSPKLEELLLRGSLDQPKDGTSYIHNPLVELWTEFRRKQVVDYLQFLEKPLQTKCLASVPKYVHQLFPYPNSSWDASKYAVDKSLRIAGDMQLGVSLYGEATYGDSFFAWKRNSRPAGGYGVTEFHPLRPMDANELQRVFQRHRENGAKFLSFFVEGRGSYSNLDLMQVKNVMSFDAANSQFGSNQLYASVRQLMTQR